MVEKLIIYNRDGTKSEVEPLKMWNPGDFDPEAKRIVRKPVTSSNLASIGYDAQEKTLEIEFVYGGTYQYPDVPPRIYTELLNAPSVGAYFHQHIRKQYPAKKVK